MDNDKMLNFKRKADQNANFEDSEGLTMQIPRMKKIGKKLKSEIPSSYICNSNDVVYFKIINSHKEFTDFQSLDLSGAFHPLYTNQIFPDEKITGYKNLKILISLTPRRLYPHIKITYDSEHKTRDNIEECLRNHYDEHYCTDESNFMEKLNEDLEKKIAPKDKTHNKGVMVYSDDKDEIYRVDILKDDFIDENLNFQAFCTFFIDGASFIPIEDNFWSYFLLYNKHNQSLLGYSSFKNFHVTLDKYRSMVSQFLILPSYQRKGYGFKLLEKIYDVFIKDDKCFDITTEDPGQEFILLRDVVIFKKLLNDPLFNKFGNVYLIKSKDEYNRIQINNKEMNEISNHMKIEPRLIKSLNDNAELFHLFKKEVQDMIYSMNRADYDFDYSMTYNRKGPYIEFFDDQDFDTEAEVEEMRQMSNSDATKGEKLEMLYAEFEKDFKEIKRKCSQMVQLEKK